jgi:8-oxo-dGTP pyrophosphatase MutT (NUDIX family)
MGDAPGPLIDPAEAPDWLRRLVAATTDLDREAFPRRAVDITEGRPAAVLMLFTEDAGEPEVLLLRRADSLGSHAGQVAFPGGGAEQEDDGPVQTAMREATEEVGVRPEGVTPLALFPSLPVPVSGFMVTPVLAYWHEPCAVAPVDPGETARVARVPIAALTDPANRFRVHHPSGYTGPAFAVSGLLVWGFTAGLLSGLLDLAGWSQPWDANDVRDLDRATEAVRNGWSNRHAGHGTGDGTEVGA